MVEVSLAGLGENFSIIGYVENRVRCLTLIEPIMSEAIAFFTVGVRVAQIASPGRARTTERCASVVRAFRDEDITLAGACLIPFRVVFRTDRLAARIGIIGDDRARTVTIRAFVHNRPVVGFGMTSLPFLILGVRTLSDNNGVMFYAIASALNAGKCLIELSSILQTWRVE